MGGLMSTSPPQPNQSKKRRLDSTQTVDTESPVMKRIRSTYEYVYQEMFRKGQGSDVTVLALNREWRLHRIYLKQSHYFAALFDGGWKDSNSDKFHLEITDENITVDALDTIFGSFYADKVRITNANVVGVLAAATWFHVEEIRNLCEIQLMKSVNFQTLLPMYELGKRYNLPNLIEECRVWLAMRLTVLPDTVDVFEFFKRIPICLMEKVVKSRNLIVLRYEDDLLSVLLKWMYLQKFPDANYCNGKELMKQSYKYFAKDAPNYIESREGSRYRSVFLLVRFENIALRRSNLNKLMKDGLFPTTWLLSACTNQWLRFTRFHERLVSATQQTTGTTGGTTSVSDSTASVAEGAEAETWLGPSPDVSEERFWQTCERLARPITCLEVSSRNSIVWRWPGYHYGVDLVFKYHRRCFTVTRAVDKDQTQGPVSLFRNHCIMLEMTVFSIANEDFSFSRDAYIELPAAASEDPDGTDPPQKVVRSGVRRMGLTPNLPYEVLRLPDDFAFPAVVAVNVMRYD